jgi:quercetin dioxygenase-like cupin family protein
VLTGRSRIAMEGRELILERGDSIGIPRGVVRRAEVAGSELVVSVDATKD